MPLRHLRILACFEGTVEPYFVVLDQTIKLLPQFQILYWQSNILLQRPQFAIESIWIFHRRQNHFWKVYLYRRVTSSFINVIKFLYKLLIYYSAFAWQGNQLQTFWRWQPLVLAPDAIKTVDTNLRCELVISVVILAQE